MRQIGLAIRTLVMVLVGALWSVPALGQGKTERQWTGCGISFSYPANWEATLIPEGEIDLEEQNCGVILRPRNYKALIAKTDKDIYSVTLIVRAPSNTLLEVADKAGFALIQGKWVIIGRQRIQTEARIFKQQGWSGIRGIQTNDCFYEQRLVHAGLCEDDLVVMASDQADPFPVILLLMGRPGASQVTEKVLATLQVLAKGPAAQK